MGGLNMRGLIVMIFCGIAALAPADDSVDSSVDDSLQSAPKYVSRGIERFRNNQIAGSVRDFQRAAQLDPIVAPRLWQLGISHYYAGNFGQGQQLFELHQTVNRNDVENAAWHFICVARVDGIASARKKLLEIDVQRDGRVPMREVYQFYAGQGSEDAVLAAAQKADTERARMYAHLYLGLYYEVIKKADQARSFMRKAAAAKLKENYMHDVAKIHLLQRKWTP